MYNHFALYFFKNLLELLLIFINLKFKKFKFVLKYLLKQKSIYCRLLICVHSSILYSLKKIDYASNACEVKNAKY